MEFERDNTDSGNQEPICPICFLNKVELHFVKNGYFVRKCCKCNYIFVWPLPRHEDTQNLYAQNYFYKNGETGCASGYTDYEKDKANMESAFNKYLFEIEKLTDERKIFDVGAATGYFLDLAKRAGWQTSGNEVSPCIAQLAQNKGHNMFVGDLTKIDLPLASYGVVTMWDVLEHVKSPQKNLTRANEILSSGGILAINTVDRKSLWARLWGKNWSMIVPPEHLHYFCLSDLQILLNRAGFKVVIVKKIGKKFSIPYILKTLHLWHGAEFWNKASQKLSTPFWRKLSIPINLRDNIFIVARKENVL